MIAFVVPLLLSGLTATSALTGEVAVLDLTKSPGKPPRPRVSAGFGGGITHAGAMRSPPKLPLKVTLESIEPSGDGEYFRVVMLLITNTSDQVYLFPASQDVDDVHEDGNRERRSLLFQLRPISEQKRLEGAAIGSAFSAAGRPDSAVRLERGQSLRVRLKVDLSPPPSSWTIPDDRKVQVRAEIVETLFDDRTDLYMIKEMRDAVSENSLPLVIP